MKETTKTLLENLLAHNESSELAVECLNILKGCIHAVDYESTGAVSTAETKLIYSRRAKIKPDSPKHFRGFGELLTALDVESDTTIVIHWFRITNLQFIIFTNLSLTRLVGVLCSP